MAAEDGNTYAQKHSKDDILKVLEDCTKGMIEYASIDTKTKHMSVDPTSKSPILDKEEKTVIKSGYSCLQRALAANGTYPQKLTEWAETWKDDSEVSEALKVVKSISDSLIYANTVEGHYPANVGIFLMKSVLCMVEKGVELEINRDVPLVKVVSVKADGTRVER